MPVETPCAVAIVRALLDWYDANARTLPWRAPPGAAPTEPYRVWLSEVMLQQTTVAAVIPYFERFLARWPSIDALAAADDAKVMSAWAGLGYYARARNLLACARAVVAEAGGRFPGSEAALRRLPGLGRYTAAAVAAIAFEQRAVVVDGNIERVVSRLFAIETPLPAAKPELYGLMDALTPSERPGDFAQAMMDLGATICTPRNPRCLICPLLARCAAARAGTAAAYPRRATKRARPSRSWTAYWLEREGEVLLVRRPPKGLLGGMRALPLEPPIAAKWRPAGRIAHGFTHFDLDLTIVRAEACEDEPAGEWWPIERLGAAGLPTLFDKAARAAMEAE